MSGDLNDSEISHEEPSPPLGTNDQDLRQMQNVTEEKSSVFSSSSKDEVDQ